MFLSNMRTASHFSLFSSARDRTLPPGPTGIPVIGAIDLLRDPIRSLQQGQREFGDVVCFRVGPVRFVSLADPDAAHHVLVSNHRNYIKSRNYQGLALVLGNGLVTSDGAHWKRQRKLAQPAFHRQRLAALADTMVDCVHQRLDEWERRGATSVDIHDEMMQLTLRIVGRTLFGADLGHDLGDLGPVITTCLHKANEYAEAVVRIPLWVPTPSNLRFRRAKQRLDEIVHGLIEQRRQQTEPGDDVLGMLMAATEEDGSGGMSDQDLRDEVMTLFMAGHETIATAMSWAWLLLHQHPQVADKVAAEVEEVLGSRRATFADLPQLAYTGRVIDEVMRLYPPAWIVEREAVADDSIGGYTVPKGAIVSVSPWLLHRHPGLWNDPLRFDPDRFGPERSAKRHKYAYLPFGGGPRICIGNHFALMEAKVILATIISRYRVHVDRPQAVQLDPRVTLRPKGGMRATLQRAHGRPAT